MCLEGIIYSSHIGNSLRKKTEIGVWGVLYQWGAPELLGELFSSQWPFPFLLWDPRPKKQNKNITTLRLQWEIKLQGRSSGGVGGSLTAQRMCELMSHHHLDPPPGSRHTDMQIGCPVGEGERTAVRTESQRSASHSQLCRERKTSPAFSVPICQSVCTSISAPLCAPLSLFYADWLAVYVFFSDSPPPLTPTLLYHLLLYPLTYLPLSVYPPLLSFLSSSPLPLTRADKNTTTSSSSPPSLPSLSEKNRLDAHACQSACGKPGQGFHRALRAVIGGQRRKKHSTIWSMCLVSGNCILKGSRSFFHSSEGWETFAFTCLFSNIPCFCVHVCYYSTSYFLFKAWRASFRHF